MILKNTMLLTETSTAICFWQCTIAHAYKLSRTIKFYFYEYLKKTRENWIKWYIILKCKLLNEFLPQSFKQLSSALLYFFFVEPQFFHWRTEIWNVFYVVENKIYGFIIKRFLKSFWTSYFWSLFNLRNDLIKEEDESLIRNAKRVKSSIQLTSLHEQC